MNTDRTDIVANELHELAVQKPARVRTLTTVDVTSLQRSVKAIPEKVWSIADSQKENDFFCFHHTLHVVLRFTRHNRDHRDFYDTPAWQLWKPKLLPLLLEITKSYGFEEPEFPKVMFARLKAGHEIDRHVDGAGSNLGTHKIHLPLQTNPKAKFFVEDEAFHLALGTAYEVNNIAPHSAVNHGTEDRIHLIFEVFDKARSNAKR